MDKKEAGKKLSLRNEKLKAKRASETEEQMKERLRIRCEKNRAARRRTKKLQEVKKSSSETEYNEKKCLAALKRLKQDDENELERNLRLEKVVNSSGWSWRWKKKEEQDWRMMQLPNGSGWPWRWTKKEKQDWRNGSYQRLSLERQTKKEKQDWRRW